MRVAGLLLAAGAGTRIGGPKALLEIGGEPLVRLGSRVLADGGCTPVRVVAGAEHERVAEVVDVVVNPAWREGIGSSLAVGLGSLDDTDVGAVVVLLVDTPGVTAAAVHRVRVAARPDRAAVATYDGRRGHPVALGRALWAAAVELARGDVGARALLAARPDLVDEVACTGDPTDIDTAADLRRWSAR